MTIKHQNRPVDPDFIGAVRLCLADFLAAAGIIGAVLAYAGWAVAFGGS